MSKQASKNKKAPADLGPTSSSLYSKNKQKTFDVFSIEGLEPKIRIRSHERKDNKIKKREKVYSSHTQLFFNQIGDSSVSVLKPFIPTLGHSCQVLPSKNVCNVF